MLQEEVRPGVNHALLASFNPNDDYVMGSLQCRERLIERPVYISWRALYTIDLVAMCTGYQLFDNLIYGRIFDGESQQFAGQVPRVYHHVAASTAQMGLVLDIIKLSAGRDRRIEAFDGQNRQGCLLV